MSSELCKSCIHHKMCMHDKNLVGDVFVAGNPYFFDNDELFKKYEEWKAKGFPCDDYMSSADVVEAVRCKDCRYSKPNDGGSDTLVICERLIEPMKWLIDDYCSYGERRAE